MGFRVLVCVLAVMASPAWGQARDPETREVRFANRSAGIELAGTLSLPGSPGRHPAVILITGSGPQDRDKTVAGQKPFAVLADDLVHKGFVVLRYDDRGVAGSGGDFAAATLADFASDAEAALTFLSEEPGVDRRKIGLIGHSEGGLVAPMVAKAAPGRVAFLVLLASPAVNGEQTFYLQDAAEARVRGADDATVARTHDRKAQIFEVLKSEPDPARAADRLRQVMKGFALTPDEQAELTRGGVDLDAMIDQQIHILNTPAIRVFLAHDPMPLLQNIDIPVLALIGERDLQVPITPNLALTAEALRRSSPCPRMAARALPGLNHLFQTSATGLPSEYAGLGAAMEPVVRDAVSDWVLNEALTPCLD